MSLGSARWLRDSTPRALLLRTTAFVILALGIWRVTLYEPALALLRITVEIPFTLLMSSQQQLPVQVDAKGDWNFSIPVHAEVKDPKDGSEPRTVDAIEFAGAAENIAPFTTGWFVYAALALSLGFSKENLRRTLLGLLIQTAINIFALYVYAEVNAQGILESFHANPHPLWSWLLKYVYHIDYLVVPYASPFLLLLLTHPWWWAELTSKKNASMAA